MGRGNGKMGRGKGKRGKGQEEREKRKGRGEGKRGREKGKARTTKKINYQKCLTKNSGRTLKFIFLGHQNDPLYC